MTKIHVGSQNQTKIQAVENVFASSDLFQEVVIKSVAVDVEEFGHPKTLTETITGA